MLVPELRNLSCQWYVAKCVCSGFCTNQGCLPALGNSILWFLKNCSEIKFRTLNKETFPKDFPFLLFSVLLLLLPIQCNAKQYRDCSGPRPHCSGSLPDRLFICPGGPGNLIWCRSQENALRTQGFLSPVVELPPAQVLSLSDLMGYLPWGRNYMCMMISSLESIGTGFSFPFLSFLLFFFYRQKASQCDC